MLTSTITTLDLNCSIKQPSQPVHDWIQPIETETVSETKLQEQPRTIIQNMPSAAEPPPTVYIQLCQLGNRELANNMSRGQKSKNWTINHPLKIMSNNFNNYIVTWLIAHMTHWCHFISAFAWQLLPYMIRPLTFSPLETAVEALVCKQCRSRWAGSCKPSLQDLHHLQVFSIFEKTKSPTVLIDWSEFDFMVNWLVWM